MKAMKSEWLIEIVHHKYLGEIIEDSVGPTRNRVWD